MKERSTVLSNNEEHILYSDELDKRVKVVDEQIEECNGSSMESGIHT